jgi:hypothetical protein
LRWLSSLERCCRRNSELFLTQHDEGCRFDRRHPHGRGRATRALQLLLVDTERFLQATIAAADNEHLGAGEVGGGGDACVARSTASQDEKADNEDCLPHCARACRRSRKPDAQTRPTTRVMPSAR